MMSNEEESRKLALIQSIREIGLPSGKLEAVVASLLYHMYDGDETKILQFVVMLDMEL